jgi:primary-amine oxidase
MAATAMADQTPAALKTAARDSPPITNGPASTSPRPHPLGPLSPSEILQSSELVKGCWPQGTDCHFKVITLLEPKKAELIQYLAAERAGRDHTSTIDRRSFVVYYLRGTVSRKLPVPQSISLL